MWRRLEFHDQPTNSHKFWAVSRVTRDERGRSFWSVTCYWGRVGTIGRSRQLFFPAHHLATEFVDSKLEEKRLKGYLEVPLASTTQMPSRKAALPDPEDLFRLPFD